MARVRLYPHRQAAPDSVTWRDWWIERDGGRAPLPPVLTGWDYASAETVGVGVDLDVEAVLDSTGLDTADDLEVLVLGDCRDTQQRFVATAPLGGRVGDPLEIPLHLPPGQLAGSVRLSAHLVLARTTPERSEGIAHLRGALLHSSEAVTVQLEGDAGRFPTEPVAFSEIGLGNAPWTVLTVHEDLSAAFMGSVRLLINTEHPAGQLLLSAPPDARMGRLLRADIIRLLVAGAAGQVLDGERAGYEDGSVGQVLETMCRLFLGRGLRMAVRLYLDHPAEFDLLLHDRINPLTELTA